MKRINKMYINGEWVEAESSSTFEDINPSDGSVWSTVPDASRKDVAAAIDAAHAASKAWASMNFKERAKMLNRAADVFEARVPDIAKALSEEGGGWFGKGMFEAGYVPEVLRAAAATLYDSVGEIMPSAYGKISMVVKHPLGVVSVISPWNFPLLLTMRGLAYALAAGNTVVLKPSEETPYTGGLVFAECFEEAGFPAGVVNVVTCARESVADVGDELVVNPKVKAISYTGSTPVGKMIAAKAGGLLKKACVELGGKDALIVLDDANLERAIGAATFGAFMHQGQICMSVERIIVQRNVAETFLKGFVEKAQGLDMGDTAKESNIIGPIISEAQAIKIDTQIQDAVAAGATALTGGKRDGRFIAPTILTNVTTDMSVWRDETFGPVAAVMIVDSDEEAIALANDSVYGLSCGVISQNEERAMRLANEIDTGMVHINCSSVNDEPHIPFGGTKESGLGRHGGKWSIDTFTETRWVTLERGGRPYPF